MVATEAATDTRTKNACARSFQRYLTPSGDVYSQIDGMDQSIDGKLVELFHLEAGPEKRRRTGFQAVNENVNIVKNNVKHTSTSLTGLYHREKAA